MRDGYKLAATMSSFSKSYIPTSVILKVVHLPPLRFVPAILGDANSALQRILNDADAAGTEYTVSN